MAKKTKLAACGLDCDACPKFGTDCDGCHAEGDHLWCGDCRIRVCCKFEHGHSNCSECKAFGCQTILDFESDQWIHHTAAVAELRQLRAQAEKPREE